MAEGMHYCHFGHVFIGIRSFLMQKNVESCWNESYGVLVSFAYSITLK